MSLIDKKNVPIEGHSCPDSARSGAQEAAPPFGRCGLAWLTLALVLLVLQRALPSAQGPAADKIEAALAQAMAQQGEANYIVFLRETADLSAATTVTNRDERGWFVYRTLKELADRTQAPLRAYLEAETRAGRASVVRSFFSANAIAVRSRAQTLSGLAAFLEIERIISEPTMSIPQPAPGVEQPRVSQIEWNIANIGADKVWSLGIRGQGIVVAAIDTGAQFNHPAIVNQYRGNLGSGVFNHSHNWWDPSSVCGFPSLMPCDNASHGTHVTGTMVGDDGAANQIGVAPEAKWIACKGCETGLCSAFALLSCGDWVLAPTDLSGQNPDPTKRPHVVNNSWGGDGGDQWYRPTVQSWVSSGIFPVFAAGNTGPFCNSMNSPGDYPESFATGATDMNGAIAFFSSRGPSFIPGSTKKPDIAAPGVNVRSSAPLNSYASFNGTSMASPHVAGSVALLWSAYDGLVRDIVNTRKKLVPATAIFNTFQGCGGDGPRTHPNNAYGAGRLDAFQMINALNIYTNQSVYDGFDTLVTRVSLVNPDNVNLNADYYYGLVSGANVFLLASGNTTIPPLFETFDVTFLTYNLTGGEPPATAIWFALLVQPGTDPSIPANHISLDFAPFAIQ